MERSKLSRTFSPEDEDNAKLMAWLSNRYAVPSNTLSKIDKEIEKEKIHLLTSAEIKQYISSAFKQNHTSVADQLFALTKPSDNHIETVRKSQRLGKGVYRNLYHIKMRQEYSSFSSILIELLHDPVSKYISSLEDEYENLFSDKINQLKTLNEKWIQNTPDPRPRDIGWKLSSLFERYKRSYFDIIGSIKNYILTELYSKEYFSPYGFETTPLFREFEKKWEQQFNEQYTKQIMSRTEIENKQLMFTLTYTAWVEIDFDLERDLFAKYGETSIIDFVNKYHVFWDGLSENNKYEGLAKAIEKGYGVSVGAEVVLGKYTMKSNSGKEITVETDNNTLDPIISKYKTYMDKMKRRHIIRSLNLSRKEAENLDIDRYSIDFDELISDAIDQSDLDQHYFVSSMFKIKNTLDSIPRLFKIGAEYLTIDAIKYPLISYNVPNDLSLILNIVLEDTDLYKLSTKYIESLEHS